MKNIVIIVFFLFYVGIVYCDDGQVYIYPESGNIVLVKNNNIRMIYEKVVYKDEKVSANFIFQNDSDNTEKVIFGFPVYYDIDYSYKDNIFADNYCNEKEDLSVIELKKRKIKVLDQIKEYFNFKTNINGKEIVREIYGVDEKKYGYNFVFTTEYTFMPNEKLVINDSYNQKISWSSSPIENIKTLNYVIKSGATWKNGIENGEFEFYFSKKQKEDDNKDVYGINRYFQEIDEGGYFSLVKNSVYSNIPIQKIEENKEYVILKYHLQNSFPNEDIKITIKNKNSDYDKLFGNIQGIGSESFYINNKDFFEEMQFIESFKSFIVALAELKLSEKEYKKDGEYYEYYGNTKIRFIINGMSALDGYKFKNEPWKSFYERFNWYKNNNNKLTNDERKMLDKIIKIEKE